MQPHLCIHSPSCTDPWLLPLCLPAQVFTSEQRDFYDIESFYAAAEEVELPLGGQGQGGPGASAGVRGMGHGAGAGGAGAAANPTWSKKY